MRNGNFGFSGEPGGCNLVLTVPMRNGNKTKKAKAQTTQERSYRTYEEWKP